MVSGNLVVTNVEEVFVQTKQKLRKN